MHWQPRPQPRWPPANRSPAHHPPLTPAAGQQTPSSSAGLRRGGGQQGRGERSRRAGSNDGAQRGQMGRGSGGSSSPHSSTVKCQQPEAGSPARRSAAEDEAHRRRRRCRRPALRWPQPSLPPARPRARRPPLEASSACQGQGSQGGRRRAGAGLAKLLPPSACRRCLCLVFCWDWEQQGPQPSPAAQPAVPCSPTSLFSWAASWAGLTAMPSRAAASARQAAASRASRAGLYPAAAQRSKRTTAAVGGARRWEEALGRWPKGELHRGLADARSAASRRPCTTQTALTRVPELRGGAHAQPRGQVVRRRHQLAPPLRVPVQAQGGGVQGVGRLVRAYLGPGLRGEAYRAGCHLDKAGRRDRVCRRCHTCAPSRAQSERHEVSRRPLPAPAPRLHPALHRAAGGPPGPLTPPPWLLPQRRR